MTTAARNLTATVGKLMEIISKLDFENDTDLLAATRCIDGTIEAIQELLDIKVRVLEEALIIINRLPVHAQFTITADGRENYYVTVTNGSRSMGNNSTKELFLAVKNKTLTSEDPILLGMNAAQLIAELSVQKQ